MGRGQTTSTRDPFSQVFGDRRGTAMSWQGALVLDDTLPIEDEDLIHLAEVDDQGNNSDIWKIAGDGPLHRVHGHARVKHGVGVAKVEEWLQDGKLHRAGGPARITVAEDGSRIEEYWQNDIPYRENSKPNYVETSMDRRTTASRNQAKRGSELIFIPLEDSQLWKPKAASGAASTPNMSP